jgi:amidohydrolase
MPASEIADEVRQRSDGLIALRRDFHRHPELGFGERRTAEIVAERLHRAGLEVTTGVAGTGVVGVLRGDRPGRTIAWRADMDALPLHEPADRAYASAVAGVMHACGHDGHTAIAIVVAELLAARRAELPGTAVFLFQPAEELLAGARPMLDARVLDEPRVDEIYGLHLVSRVPTGRVELTAGTAMASADLFELEVTGRGGHGASPHLAIDPIVVSAHLVIGLSQVVTAAVAPDDAAVVTIGEVAAGTAPNIIPERAVMRGSLRALRSADRRVVLERLEAYARSLAAAHRARAALRLVGEPCPALVNHDGPTAHVHRCAAGELGAACVVAGRPVLASDDMSVFLGQRPGCYFRVGAAPPGREPPPHHSSEFDLDEAGLAVGARVAATVLLGSLAP